MKNRLTEYRKARGMTLDAVAKLAGTTRGQIWKLENGEIQLTPRWLDRLSKALDCEPLELLGGSEGLAGAAGRDLPVIDYVQAGDWTAPVDPYAKGDGMAVVHPATRVSAKAFALEIRGNSMEPEFREGDRVIVDPAVSPLPGDFVVAKLDDAHEATFKKYRPLGTGKGAAIELIALNPDWPALRIDRQNPGRIVATMVEHHRYRRR